MTQALPTKASRLDVFLLAVCLVAMIDSCASQPMVSATRQYQVNMLHKAPTTFFNAEVNYLAII